MYKMIWTKIGLAKRANAEISGLLVDITHFALGDANGNEAFEPDQDMEALVHEVYRRAVDTVEIDEGNPAWVNVDGHILAADGGWWVREVGLIDADGDLVAIGNKAPFYKPLLAEGEGDDLYLRMILLTSNTAVIQLRINPAIAMASRKYVDDGGPAWKAAHIRVVTQSGPVFATDRGISIDATAGDIDLMLFAASNPAARELILHREDNTANKVNLLVVAGGTICRQVSMLDALAVQDETLRLLPKSTTNNWLKIGQ